MDRWSEPFKDDLIIVKDEAGEYSVRLLTLDELIQKFYYVVRHGSYTYIIATNDTPDYIYDDGKTIWTMSGTDNNKTRYVMTRYVFDHNIYETALIRPVINVKKCSLNEIDCECKGIPVYGKETAYKEYNVGDVVQFKGESYHVVRPSDSDNNYIALLKDDVISDELISKYTDNDYIESIPFVKGENYLNKYDKSYIKTIVDKWATDIFDDNELIEVNGNSARLLSGDEIKMYLGFEYRDSSPYHALRNVESGFEWLKPNGKDYWLDEYSSDYYGSIMLNDGIISEYIKNNHYVRPVIHLNKCMLEDGCYETDTIISCQAILNNSEDKEEIVNVDNTLSNISKIVLLVSLSLISLGGVLLIKSFKKSK